MRITDFSRTRRGRWSIFLDGEFACALHEEVFASSALSVGDEITPERLEELHRTSQRRIARERAMSLLSARSYTARGLYDKLASHTDEESAAAAVERMQELGLVDDRDYARRFALDCVNLKRYSLRRTARALAEKGVDRDIIQDTLAEMEQDPEAAVAAILRRKYWSGLEDEKGVKRAVNGLLRLGYDYADIRRVLENLAEDENYYGDGAE